MPESEFAPSLADSGKKFTVTPAGTFVARCCHVIYLGRHMESYSGEPAKEKKKLRIAFELPQELHVFNPDKGAEPFMIGREYTWSMNENAKMRQHLESWRAETYTEKEIEEFNPRNMIDAPALLTIVHEVKPDGKTVAKIQNIGPLVKGMVCPPAILPKLVYSVNDGRDKVYESLPKFLKEKVNKCMEWAKLPPPAAAPSPEQPAPNQSAPAAQRHPF